VTVFQAGEDNGVLFLAMPLLRGQTLQQRLEEVGGPLPVEEILRVAGRSRRGWRRPTPAGWFTATSSRGTCGSPRRMKAEG